MQIIIQEDIDRILADRKNVQYTLSQMVALMNDTDTKVDAMKSQRWYQRMVKTVFGKNKVTKEEIAANHDKLNAYMAEAVSELFKRNAFTSDQLVSLGSQINQIYENIPEIKEIVFDSVIKLNNKIRSLDTYVVLTQKITLGEYVGNNEICTLFDVVAQIDNQVVMDENKKSIILRLLAEKIEFASDRTLCEYLKSVLHLPGESYETLYSNAVSIGSGALWARLIMQIIERYHFLPIAEKRAIDSEAFIEDMLAANMIKGETIFSIGEIYDNLLEARVNQAETERTASVSAETELDNVSHLVEGYSNDNDSEIKETQDMESNNANDGDDDEAHELEDYYIDHIMTIAEDEKIDLSYKDIHIRSFVDCKGFIILSNCTIHYNESEHSDEIIFSGTHDGGIWAKDCTFICHAADSHHFIGTHNGQVKTAIFENCRFVDCSNFIHRFGIVGLENCTIMNCAGGFAHASNTLSVENTIITYNGLTDFNRKEVMGVLFYAECGCLQNSKVEFSDDAFEVAPELKKLQILFSNDGVVLNTTIVNVKSSNYAFGVAGVGEVLCRNCSGLFDIRESHNTENAVSASCFEDCTKIVYAGRNTAISKCRFVHCHDSMIETMYSGVSVKLCEFYDCYSSNSETERMTTSLYLEQNQPMIHYRTFSENKYEKLNTVEKCIFTNIDTQQSYLIAGDIIEIPKYTPILVRDCDFRNCSSQNGLLIRTEDKYDGFFKSKNVKAITIENCRGLDKVKTEYDGQRSNVDTTENIDGVKVGASF